ncbi:MAG: Fur family transcriptional regulator [Clostridiales bacterium]
MEKLSRYNTKQRDRIMDFLLKNQDNHITVDDITEAFKDESTPIGKSTIYRYMDVLVNEGIVRKYITQEGYPACFQYCGDNPICKEHFHLKCSGCHQLFHVESPILAAANCEIQEKYGFTIDSSKTVFYGYCQDCIKEQNNEK